MNHNFKFTQNSFHLKQKFSYVNQEVDSLSCKFVDHIGSSIYSSSTLITTSCIWFDQCRIGIFYVHLLPSGEYHVFVLPRLEFSSSYTFENLLLAIIDYLVKDHIASPSCNIVFPLINPSQGNSTLSFSPKLKDFIRYV